jgi:hypothetical protein
MKVLMLVGVNTPGPAELLPLRYIEDFHSRPTPP